MTSLAETQRWMLAAMAGDDPAQPGRSGAARQALVSPVRRSVDADSVVNGAPGLSAEQRVALYRTSRHRRLVGCLRDTYPGLCHALGDELFEDFAADYLAAHPPRGHSLAALGAAFPDHLAATRPDDVSASWPDFLVDLARLERAFHEVYDGPGTEGADPPAVPGGSDLRIEPAPCLRLLAASHPVDDYLVAVRHGDHPLLPTAEPCFLALARRDWVVTITRLDAAGHALLELLVRGSDLRAAARGAALDDHVAGALLRRWAGIGFVSAIHPGGEQR